jgi:integrin beta 3
VTPDQFGRIVGPVVRDLTAKAVQDAIAPLMARNLALEARILELETAPAVIGPVGPSGAKGDVGVGVSSLTLRADGWLLAHMTDGRSVDVGPVPVADGRDGINGKDGRDGIDGKNGADGTPGPIGVTGANGADGRDGAPGTPGERGATGEKGADGTGKDGAPGRDGRDGAPGTSGTDGKAGIDGINGKDGAPGLNGKDGIDGMGFDDFDLILDEQRGWILRLVKGERVKEWPVPMPFYRGPWEAGSTYPKSASVRWDGALWLALKSTVEKPGEGSPDWQLLVSRGKQGREGPKGPRGDDGKDLTQMDPNTGRKW